MRAVQHNRRPFGHFTGQRELPVPVPTLVVVVGITALLGLAAGANPTLVLAGVVGCLVIATMLLSVTAGLMLFVIVAFVESLPTIGGAPSLAKLLGIVLVASWMGALAAGRPGERGSLDFLSGNTMLTWAICGFVVWVFASSLWAEDAAVARTTFFRYALNLALFPIVFAAVTRPRHVVALFGFFAGCGVVVAVVGMASSGGFSSGGGDRLQGAGLNPNQLGALLGVGAVLGATLAFYPRIRQGWRILAGSTAGVSVVLLVLTGSRGAMLGLLASLFVTPFLIGPGKRLGAICLVTGGTLALGIWLALVAPAATVDRLMSSGGGGSGRIDLWTIAMRMFHAHPLTGVGAGNFPVSSVNYLLEPGRITYYRYIVDEPKVTHNVYLQVLAELGVVGLALFLLIISLCLVKAFRAARVFRLAGDDASELLARGLLIALAGLLLADFFSSELYSKQLYLLLGTGPALAAMAARRAAAGDRSTSGT